MKSRTLVVLQNLDTKEYVESLSNESEISWVNGWAEARDFNDMFFIKRWFLRLRLENKFKGIGLKLKWKKVIVFEGVRGLV
jgi:hypothetical protein